MLDLSRLNYFLHAVSTQIGSCQVAVSHDIAAHEGLAELDFADMIGICVSC